MTATPSTTENEPDTKGGPAMPVLFLLGFVPAFYDGPHMVMQVCGHKHYSWPTIATMLDRLEEQALKFARGFSEEKQGPWSYQKCLKHLTDQGWLIEELPAFAYREGSF